MAPETDAEAALTLPDEAAETEPVEGPDADALLADSADALLADADALLADADALLANDGNAPPEEGAALLEAEVDATAPAEVDEEDELLPVCVEFSIAEYGSYPGSASSVPTTAKRGLSIHIPSALSEDVRRRVNTRRHNGKTSKKSSATQRETSATRRNTNSPCSSTALEI